MRSKEEVTSGEVLLIAPIAQGGQLHDVTEHYDRQHAKGEEGHGDAEVHAPDGHEAIQVVAQSLLPTTRVPSGAAAC